MLRLNVELNSEQLSGPASWEVFVVSLFMLYLVQTQNVHASLSSTDRRFLRYYYVWAGLAQLFPVQFLA